MWNRKTPTFVEAFRCPTKAAFDFAQDRLLAIYKTKKAPQMRSLLLSDWEGLENIYKHLYTRLRSAGGLNFCKIYS